MELRKDPITRSWVITGDDVIEPAPRSASLPVLRPSAEPAQVIANLPGVDGSAWSARSVVHPHALYHIEGEPARRGDGLYDRMGSVGAHEVLLENPRHDGHLGMRATPKSNSSCVGGAAHSGFEARQPLQVHQHFQESRRGAGAGIRASHLATDRDHLRAAPRALRTPRRTRLFSRERSAASSATFWRRRSVRTCASSKLAETTWPSAPMLRASPTKPGFCRAAMNLHLSAPAHRAWAA
jgi:hypothetical protein